MPKRWALAVVVGGLVVIAAVVVAIGLNGGRSKLSAAVASKSVASKAATPSPARSGPTASVCQPGSLQLTNPSSLAGGMGGAIAVIVFRNAGSVACSMIGWPTIGSSNVATHVLYQTTTGAGFEVPVARVVLQPGESAASSLNLFGALGTTYGEQCAGAGSWMVTAPGAATSTSVPWPAHQGACPDGTVLVSPVYLGDQPNVGFGSADPTSVPVLGPFSSPPPISGVNAR